MTIATLPGGSHAIVAVAARGPGGDNVFQVAMCARAKQMSPRSSRFVDKRGRSIGLCTTRGLSDELVGYERLLALASPALSDLSAEVNRTARPPLLLALPAPGRPDDDPRFASELAHALSEGAGLAIDRARSASFRAGHAGTALAMERAARLLDGAEGDDIPEVIVGGVDSYFHSDVLAWLDRECRLHALDAEDGFIPSEGAAFVLLRRRGSAGAAPMAKLLGVETDREASVVTGEPNLAVAMTQSMRRLSRALGDQPIDWSLSDVNGERHRVREWSMVEIRSAFASDATHHRLAEDLGEVGAAIGVTLTAIACSWWRLGCAPASSAVVALHSEGGERGAFMIADATRE